MIEGKDLWYSKHSPLSADYCKPMSYCASSLPLSKDECCTVCVPLEIVAVPLVSFLLSTLQR